MFLKPSRPPMHANSASETEVLLCSTGTSQLVKEVKWFLLFPTITESSKPDDKFGRKQYSIWRFKNKFGPGQE